MTATTTAPTEWVTEGRPAGQPGTVGRKHRSSAWTYPAVTAADGTVWYWRDTTDSAGRWIAAPSRLADSFEPDEEWKSECDHVHACPWQTCAFEADCVSLRREEARRWGR